MPGAAGRRGEWQGITAGNGRERIDWTWKWKFKLSGQIQRPSGLAANFGGGGHLGV